MTPTRTDVNWWRQKALGLFFFNHVVLGHFWEDKFRDFGIVHRLACNFLDSRLTPSRRKFFSMFRGSFKTTVLLGYVIWTFCWAVATGKPVSICYNTATKENAEAFMIDFRETILGSELLHWIFPQLPREPSQFRKWTKWRVEFKNVKFHVASLDTRQVSRHYTIIINDDLVNDKNAYSATEREKILNQWKLQKAIATRYAKFQVGIEIDTGTPFHHKDLVSHIRKIPTYEHFIIPYALEDGRGHVDPVKENGILSFPEMFCWEDFRIARDDMGASFFATQYGLETVDEADQLSKPEWIRRWSYLPDVRKRVMIVDPAGLKEKTSSATGVNISDIDQNGQIYIIHGLKYWVTPKDLILLMVRLKDQYNPDEIYVEKEKYSITIADTMEHLAPKLNFSYVEPKGMSKPSRILRMRQYFETGRILLGPGMSGLEDSILAYSGEPEGFDDLDAMAYQLTVMNPPKRGQRRVEQDRTSTDFEDEMGRIMQLYNQAPKGVHDAVF